MTNNKKISRTNYVIRNAWVGIGSQIFTLLLSFISRTIFISFLNKEYLGINGLFSNILTMLSFVEMGLGTAVIYSMYKPLAINDNDKLKALVNFYKKAYQIIGLTILILGLLVIPFMGVLIKETPDIKENLILIYILFLLGTVIPYFFSHKTSIITADQKNYIVILYNQAFKSIQIVFQILVLIFTRNYILYLITQILFCLITYVALSIKSDKLYPFLKDNKNSVLNEDEKKSIITNVKSVFLYKFSPAILNGTDNIIISSCIGLAAVGIYSNYYLITNSLVIMLSQLNNSFTASIGNLNAIEKTEKKEQVFYKIMYISFILYGICAILIFSLINDFINVWVGEEYLLSLFTVFTIVLYFYIDGLQYPVYAYRNTTGLFVKSKYTPIFEVIINIVLSIILANLIGLPGVFLATSISKLLVFWWVDPYLIYKYIFKTKLSKYFITYFKYFFMICFTGLISYLISSLFPVTSYLTWFLKAVIISIIVVIILILFTFKTKEFKELKQIALNYITKIINIFKNKFLKNNM